MKKFIRTAVDLAELFSVSRAGGRGRCTTRIAQLKRRRWLEFLRPNRTIPDLHGGFVAARPINVARVYRNGA